MATVPKTTYKPFVPEHVTMRELTLRAVLLGLVLTVVLGAANAYLGLRAGVTIAATYPAAVISLAVLRGMNGSLLEENIARTAGSIGESVAAGAVFTLPAFLIAHAWPSFGIRDAYWKSTVLMMVGSVLGVLFVSLVRRVMVEDPELPLPGIDRRVANSQGGAAGGAGGEYLFWNIGVGGVVFLLGRFGLFAADKEVVIPIGQLGASRLRLGGADTHAGPGHGRCQQFCRSQRQPRLPGGRLHHWAAAGGAFSSRAAYSPGGCWFRCLSIFWGPSSARFFPPMRRWNPGAAWPARSEIYRQAHCRRRHVSRRGIYALAHAHQYFRRLETRGARFAADARSGRPTLAYRALHEFESRLRADRAGVPCHGRALHLFFERHSRRHRRGDRDADPRFLFRHHFGLSGRHHRLVEQSRFRASRFVRWWSPRF